MTASVGAVLQFAEGPVHGVTEKLLTVQNVADRLKVTPETVRRWLRTGKLHGALPGGDEMGYRIAR